MPKYRYFHPDYVTLFVAHSPFKSILYEANENTLNEVTSFVDGFMLSEYVSDSATLW
jgi:hypothetical protein